MCKLQEVVLSGSLFHLNANMPPCLTGTKKGDVKARTILSVKNTLRRKGIKAELKEIPGESMEQAEARYKEWQYRVA